MEERHTAGIALKSDLERWLDGIPYEVAFWRSYYADKRSRKKLFARSKYGKECELDDFDIAAYIGSLDGSTGPVLLDVGCALSYAFGNLIGGREMKVTYVDPLAPFYNDILRRYRIDRPAITYGMIETLSASFAAGSVDFVHVRNALDHCANPLEGIIQALVILRKGGVLYLRHFINEAQNEGYRGFHQYNLSEQDGHLILWNRENHIDVTDTLRGFAEVKTTVVDGPRVVSVIKKTADVPTELYDPAATAQRLSEMLITTVRHFYRFGPMMKYQGKRLYSTIGHRTMRLIPRSMLGLIKRLLSASK